MSIWKSKHVTIAVIMAPILALVSYFGINAIVGEKPLAAEAGQSYKLVEKPNCRYRSGTCGLKNGDFELTLNFTRLANGRLLLKLGSEYPLDGVMLALVENEADEKQPVAMRPESYDGLMWSLDIARPDPERNRLRLVVSSGKVLYFGDVATKFTLAETGL